MPRRTIQQVLSQDPLFGSAPQAPSSDQPGPAALQGSASLVSKAAPGTGLPSAAASAAAGPGAGAPEGPHGPATAPAPVKLRRTHAGRLAASTLEQPAPPPAASPAFPVSPPQPLAPSTRPRTHGPRPERAPTARVAVWVRPLPAHKERIAATGLPPQDVLKAAWRRAAASCALAPDYVAPSPAERAEGREHCYATTLTVDAGILEGLVRAHDRLRIRSHWSLICGQVEPAFWHALDDLLTELEQDSHA